MKLFPHVYGNVAEQRDKDTNAKKLGSFTYDGQSAQLGSPIAGRTF